MENATISAHLDAMKQYFDYEIREAEAILCKEAGCVEPSGLCSKAAEAVMESEENYLTLCEESCKRCGESKQPRRPKPERTVYVA